MIIQKSETNIIEVIRDNINKQKCLKVMKCILLVISICAVSIIGLTIYRLKKPQNYISPVAKDSIEMQTAELLAGPDGAFIYKLSQRMNTTEIPILENAEDREYYGRSATEIKSVVDIRYNKQQPLIAFLYDDDAMSVPALDDLVNSQTDFISKNDYVYYVAFEFCKAM